MALKYLIAIFMQDKKGNGDKINHSLLTAKNDPTGSLSRERKTRNRAQFQPFSVPKKTKNLDNA